MQPDENVAVSPSAPTEAPAEKKKRGRKPKAARATRTPRENPFEKVFGGLAPFVRNLSRDQKAELRRAIKADSSKLDAINARIEKLQAKAHAMANATEIVQSYRQKFQIIADTLAGDRKEE